MAKYFLKIKAKNPKIPNYGIERPQSSTHHRRRVESKYLAVDSKTHLKGISMFKTILNSKKKLEKMRLKAQKSDGIFGRYTLECTKDLILTTLSSP